jgi:hypothetical protein
MSPTLVHGIILLFLTMAAAAFSKPIGGVRAESGTPGRPDSSIAVPDKKPMRAKPEKPAAPLAKPESGEEVESEDTQEDEEAASDCDDCVLAWERQVIVPPGLARAGSTRVSALSYPG